MPEKSPSLISTVLILTVLSACSDGREDAPSNKTMTIEEVREYVQSLKASAVEAGGGELMLDCPADRKVFTRTLADGREVPVMICFDETGERLMAVEGSYVPITPENVRRTMPVVYDKAEYHMGDVDRARLPEDYAYTHTGFYMSWLAQNGLLSDWITESSADELSGTVETRTVSPIRLYESWDGALIDDMLSDEGNAFSGAYYSSGLFFADYVETFDVKQKPYTVAPTWENYDLLKPVLDRRYADWKAGDALSAK